MHTPIFTHIDCFQDQVYCSIFEYVLEVFIIEKAAILWSYFGYTVKPANSGLSRETEKVAVIDMCCYSQGLYTVIIVGVGGLSGHMKLVTAIDRWPLRQI